MTIRTLDISTLTLERGRHDPDHTYCVEEAVAYVAGEEWTDFPKCVDFVIADFLRYLNDSLNDEDRQALKVLIQPQIGTAGSKKLTARRELMLFDWTIRTAVPEWLDLANLHREAASLRDLREITERQFLIDARSSLAASLAASEAASRAASRAASWAASWAASRAASWAASWAASEAASRAASKHLHPTIIKLRDSAIQLVLKMCAVKEDP